MYNMTCPEHLPFYVFSTRECIEYCAAYEIFRNSCMINDRLGFNTLFASFRALNVACVSTASAFALNSCNLCS